jgi:hypothetical protein
MIGVEPLRRHHVAILQEAVVLGRWKVDAGSLSSVMELIDAGLCEARDAADGRIELVATEAGFRHALDCGFVKWKPAVGHLVTVTDTMYEVAA